MSPVPVQYDYDSPRRGAMATLRDAHSDRLVVLSEWPETLLQMLTAGVLTGDALKEAEELREGMEGV